MASSEQFTLLLSQHNIPPTNGVKNTSDFDTSLINDQYSMYLNVLADLIKYVISLH